LAGASYMDIHNAGGGIHYTVEHTRRASEEDLFRLLRERLIRMSKSGVYVCVCGSISPDSITLSLSPEERERESLA
jgi:imidazolonepropionase